MLICSPDGMRPSTAPPTSAWGEARGKVSDAAIAEARSAGLSEADIVEVVANVVANIFTNYLNHVADTDIDFPVRRSRAA